MSKPSIAEFVPLAFVQETGSVIQWFKMPKEERLNYWKRSIQADHKDTTEPHEKPWDYREAKGILSLSEPPEDIVRRSRDRGTHDL